LWGGTLAGDDQFPLAKPLIFTLNTPGGGFPYPAAANVGLFGHQSTL
jgi:hypothetical protein